MIVVETIIVIAVGVFGYKYLKKHEDTTELFMSSKKRYGDYYV